MTNQAPEPVEPAPAASHPGVDQLADFQVELLPPAEAAAVRAHLTHCPDCAETLGALAELTELLGATESPAMPADIALRIDAALAAEAAQPGRPAGPADPGEVSRTAAEGPLAASVRRPAGTAPPGRADAVGGPGRARVRRRARLLLAAAAGCLALFGIGTAVVVSGPGAGPSSTSAASRSVSDTAAPKSAAVPEFTAAGLPDQIHALLPTASHAAGSAPHATNEQVGPATAQQPLPGCVESAVAGHAGEQPLTIAHGRFGATPVDVYVFPIAGDPTRLDVFLLDRDCATLAPLSPATVRLHQVVPAA